ncbi:DNRLRE domain-containing protein [Comamonas sp. JC664]|uniref:CBM96 family carbohydrate-binding protein n=1 Tax=Comamonas sp. JC664 TaxID=2801917 RepID=UPI00191E8EC3|nr:DNRLRE domain-containing protein [Comamonas sp. JC664]
MLPLLGMAVGCGGAVTEEAGGQQRQTAAVEAAALPPGCEILGTEYHASGRPAGDTYVTQDAPDTPNPASAVIISDGNPRQEAYLRFRVDGLSRATVLQATLRLHAQDGSSNGPALYATSPDWSEHTLTWNTRPPPVGPPLANVGAIASGTFVEYDVTAHVTEDGLYGFVLLPEVGDGTDFAADRHPNTSLRPELRLRLREEQPRCQHFGTGGAVTQVLRGDAHANALAADSSGGFALLSTVHYDAAPYGTGLRLTRYDANGTPVWTREHPQPGEWLTLGGLALTPLGNLLVYGRYTGALDLGAGPVPGTGAGTYGLFIAKFSPTGQFVWAHAFRSTVQNQGTASQGQLMAHGIATDANGSLILTGEFQGQLDLGGGVLDAGPSSHPPGGPRGMFLAKFSWEGTHLWSHAFAAGEDGSTQGHAVATDSQGHVLVGGNTSGTNALGTAAPQTPFIARFLPTGELQWARRLDGVWGNIMGVAPMPDDAVAFSGHVRGTFTFAGTPLTSMGESPDMVLGVLETTSADRWGRLYGGIDGEYNRGLVVDAQGNLVTKGFFNHATDLGAGTLNPYQAGEVNPYVASHGPDGSHRWSRAMGEGLIPTLLAMTPSGETLFGGYLLESEPIRVDQTHYTSDDGFTFLLRLSP